ncbi:hypothetical protein I3842_Q107400 [Carya illinoinensis]|uniref:CREG-like beta-barrel domain-containing protein n=1 Tax=Carya illinoinensis TaxID=32201 RepID=A0A921ZXX1_CARIL|nr:hypothetical protein I3842_Q107400 [Carya illinoinensis]
MLGHCSFSGRFLQSSATPKIQDLHQVHLFSIKFQMKRSIKPKKRLLQDVLQFELQRIIAHFLAACNTTRIYAYKYSILARSSSSPSCTFSVQTAGFGEIGNMGIKGLLYNFHLFSLVLLFVGFLGSVHGRLPLIKKPDPDDAAVTARWLVSNNVWGVLNTISSDLGGAPFGNVVSFSDGLPGKGGGIPFFYLTTLDPTARNAMEDERASLTISEYPIGTCGNKDPENPSCAKITLIGKLKVVDKKSKEAEFAKSALFSKHAEMKGWPIDHDFQFFKLEIESIFLIDWFGGPKPLTVEQYLHPKM